MYGDPLVWNVLKIKDLEKAFEKIPYEKLMKLPSICHKQFEQLDPEMADKKATRLEKRIRMFPGLVAAVIEKRAKNLKRMGKM